MNEVDQAEHVLYQKINGQFEAVGVRTDHFNWLPNGHWLVSTHKSGASYRCIVDPSTIQLQAAASVLTEHLVEQLLQASRVRLDAKIPLTAEQQAAWNQLEQAMGNQRFFLSWPSMQEVAQTAVTKFVEKVHPHRSHPMVQQLVNRLDHTLVMLGSKTHD